MKLWKWRKSEKKEKNESTSGALYPKNNLEEEEIKSYKYALDAALKDDRINNIAITAPYGIGKSTILESYFRLRKESYPSYIQYYNKAVRGINRYKKNNFLSPNFLNEIDDYEFISLPNFFDNVGSNELQKKVVEQLLFKSDPKKYPFSKLKRIKDTSLIRDIATLLLLFFIIGTSLYLYSKVSGKQFPLIASLSVFNYFEIFLTILISIFLLFFLVGFVRKARTSLAKSTVSGKGNFGPFEFSSSPEENNSELDIFNMFSEELLYFFRKTRTKIVVFEDLDRFGKPEIFQELRELNTNINKRQPKVVFIYSLQDKVFEKIIENEKYQINIENDDIDTLHLSTLSDERVRSKAKFFDYVIPIFPVTSLYNSSNTIEKELARYDIFPENKEKKLNQGFIRSVGLYLKDHRMITLIVSEFNIYLNILSSATSNDIDLKILFSMIIYKNFYAGDFEKIGYGNSLLNRVFDNSHSFYSKLISVKTRKLEKEKADLESQIVNLQHHLDYDLNTILMGYYRDLRNKYEIAQTNIQTQFFLVNKKSYFTDNMEEFFTDIANLEDSTVISTRTQSYTGYSRNFTVKDAFTLGGESKDIRDLVQSNFQGKTTSSLLLELTTKVNKVRNEIKELANNTYQLSTGTVLRELSEYHEKADDLGQAIQEIEGDPFKRFLFFNDYLTPNFYSYISPVDFGENPKDSLFIEGVLSYSNMQDYSLVDIKNTVKELDLAGANYSFAYSSNLLSYLLNITGYELEKSLIIDKMIEKNDFKFWDNLLSYSRKNNLNFLYGLKIIPTKSNSFFIRSFAEISEANNGLSIKVLIENFKEIIDSVGDTAIEKAIFTLINDTNSFSNIVNILMNLDDSNIVNDHRVHFRIKELFEIVEMTNNKNNGEVVKYLYKEALYEETYNNMESFGILFNIDASFELYTKKFKELGIRYLNVYVLYDYFETIYNKGYSESYSGFNEFIDFTLREHAFYKKFINEPLSESQREKEKYKCLVYFSKISFINNDYESNKRIVEKLNLDSLIDKEIVKEEVILELISLSRLNYSSELLEAISIKFPNLITVYLLSIYNTYPDILTEYFEGIQQFLTDKEILYLIKEIYLQKDYLKLGTLLKGDIGVWSSILKENPLFFDDDIITKIIHLKDFSLTELLFEIICGDKQAKVLNELLTNFPGQLSLSGFEQVFRAKGYLSNHLPYTQKSQINEGLIPENIMDVLDTWGIIGYRNEKQKFIVKRDIEKYLS